MAITRDIHNGRDPGDLLLPFLDFRPVMREVGVPHVQAPLRHEVGEGTEGRLDIQTCHQRVQGIEPARDPPEILDVLGQQNALADFVKRRIAIQLHPDDVGQLGDLRDCRRREMIAGLDRRIEGDGRVRKLGREVLEVMIACFLRIQIEVRHHHEQAVGTRLNRVFRIRQCLFETLRA